MWDATYKIVLTALASEMHSKSPVIICRGVSVSKEVSILLFIFALTFTTSTFVCVRGCLWSLTSCEIHHSCLPLLWPEIDHFFLARISMTLLLHLFGTYILSVSNKFWCTFFASDKFFLDRIYISIFSYCC